MPRGTVRIIGASTAATWIARLEAAGYEIDHEPVAGPDDLKRLAQELPLAVVLDLDRAPARGRDIALALRQQKTSPLAADHTGEDVRRVGLAAGLVDFKLCAVDEDWSGLAFVRRRR